MENKNAKSDWLDLIDEMGRELGEGLMVWYEYESMVMLYEDEGFSFKVERAGLCVGEILRRVNYKNKEFIDKMHELLEKNMELLRSCELIKGGELNAFDSL